MTYLSFDHVDIGTKQIYDEGPYKNHASYLGNVEFITGNFTCGNAASFKDGGEIYFNGYTFKHIPSEAITIAAWIYADSTLHKQSVFSTKATGSVGGNCVIFLFGAYYCL